MIKLNVNLGERSYPIYVSSDFSGLGRAMTGVRLAGTAVVVTDSHVDRCYGDALLPILEEAGFKAHKCVIPAGEKNKNLETVREIYRKLVEFKLDRNATLIALGGGVVGDITGFAAATFLRGIPFVQVPTSLLAQADSSVGGKVGVDFEGSKNIIGAFYQPRLVYINVNTLRTLPERELRSGLAEVIKHGLIQDADFYEYVDYNLKKIYSFDENVLHYITKMNCSIKGHVVELDEKESDLRAILNFGHTFGHAIESVSGFRLLHGECVSIGMIGAYKLAQFLEMVDESLVAKVSATLEKAGLPVKAKGLDIDEVYRQMFHDKKIKGNKLTFILPRNIGEVLQVTLDDEELIKRVLGEIIE